MRGRPSPVDRPVSDPCDSAEERYSYPLMTISAATSSAGGRVQPGLPMKAVVAVVIGNWLEFYDFLVFTFFAVMIGDAFFPAESQFGRLLGALATFGVGFVTRPLGAALIG